VLNVAVWGEADDLKHTDKPITVTTTRPEGFDKPFGSHVAIAWQSHLFSSQWA